MIAPHHAKHVRECLRRHGVRGAAIDDLAQEVLVIAFQRKIAARAALRATARKVAANYRRLYRHRFEVIDQDAVYAAIVEPMEPELRADVRRALDALDPIDAQILVLHALEGLSLAELARELGLAKSGARVRLERARRRFAERLG